MDSAAPQRRARKPGQTGCGGPAQRRVGRAHQGIAAAEDHAHEEQEDEHLHGVAGHHAIPGLVAHTRQRRTSLAAVGGSFFSCAGEQAHPKSCFLKPLKLAPARRRRQPQRSLASQTRRGGERRVRAVLRAALGALCEHHPQEEHQVGRHGEAHAQRGGQALGGVAPVRGHLHQVDLGGRRGTAVRLRHWEAA